ncbi:hypothetical protein [Fervidibacillus halotolerans]|uniref:Uncharacterized protein n=1 Tax=Fervidibacillus halotolerans TaxID=2980027 RepID=A0A9E8M0K5_9BACI|nr:hypothetical protein [Fervidibacillus halotolerans]WAA12710.1 hypothetical protein OE105_00770 [Fervidibacillus halotolerans]
MWAIFGILIVTALIIWIEVPSLLKNHERKELIGFSIILLLAFGLSVLEKSSVPLPNPLDVIVYIYRPISDWVFGMLK